MEPGAAAPSLKLSAWPMVGCPLAREPEPKLRIHSCGATRSFRRKMEKVKSVLRFAAFVAEKSPFGTLGRWSYLHCPVAASLSVIIRSARAFLPHISILWVMC